MGERRAEYERQHAEETLRLDAAEAICRAMEPGSHHAPAEGVSCEQLADRLGGSMSHVTQILSGERNMTLRMLADMAHAIGHRVEIKLVPIPAGPGETFGQAKGKGSKS
jgi:transcriptional regulator with XRE-family HTH domain